MDIASLGIKVDSTQSDQAARSMDGMTSAAGKAERATQKMGQTASQAARQAAKETKEFEKSMTDAATKGAVLGQAISDGIRLAVRAVAELDRMIQNVGNMKDLAEMSGSSAAGLSSMRLAAEVAGLSMEKVSNIAIMMTRQLSAVNDESKNAGKALAVLGISVDDFRRLQPDERIRKLAEALSKVSDSGGKTALVLDIVGRGGAESIKLFNALADESNNLAGYTEELINQMDDYADANVRAGAQARITIEMLAVQMAPAFAATRGAIVDTIMALFDMGKESDALGKNNGALNFAHAIGLGIANMIDIAIKGTAQLVWLGKTIAMVAASAAALIRGEGAKGVGAVVDAYKEDIAQLQRSIANVDTAAAFEKRFQAIVNGEKTITQEVDKELQRRVDAYKRANDGVNKVLREANRAKQAEERQRIAIGRRMAIEEGEAILKANEEYQKKLAEARKAQSDMDLEGIQRSQDEINAIHEKAMKLEEETAARGRLLSAIEEEKLAIMEKDRLTFEGNDTGLAQLEKKIEAQKRYIAALKGEETAEAAEKAATKSQEAFERSWAQVGQSLSDAIIQGGLSARDLLVRAFKATVLTPMVQAGVAGILGGQSAGMQAAGGSVLGQLVGSTLGGVGSLFGAGGLGGSLAAGAGWLTGATTFGGAMSAGASLIGTGTLGGVASGLGMMAGALGPIALGIYGISKLFGSKGGPKTEGSAGFNAGSLIGNMGNELDSNAAKAVEALNDTYKRLASLLGGTREVQFGVGMSMDPRGTAPSFIDIQASNGARYTNTNVGRSEEAFQSAMAEASAFIIVESIRSSGIDQEILAYFDQVTQGLTGEAKLAAVEAVAAMAGVWQALRNMGSVVGQLSTISIQATANIVKFAGGVDQLAAGLSAYQQNFFNEFEQREMGLTQMAQMLNAPGSGWQGFTAELLSTWDKNFFRKVVEGLDLTTELGQRQFASLMKVAPLYAQIEDAAEQAGIAAKSAADAERQRRQQEYEAERDRRQQRVDEAIQNVTEAYERQKSALTSLHDELENSSKMLLDLIADLRQDTNLSTLTPEQRLAESRTAYERALIEAERDGFSNDSVNRLGSAARQLLGNARDMFASGAEYTSLFDKVQADLERTQNRVVSEADIAQKQLDALDKQVGYLANINQNVMTVAQALGQLNSARQWLGQLGGYPHADGLSRVPFDGYPATLHKDEAILTAPQADFFRSAPNLVAQLAAVRSELAMLRKENRQDAGNTIGATYDATRRAAQLQAEATHRAARQGEYRNRTRPVLA